MTNCPFCFFMQLPLAKMVSLDTQTVNHVLVAIIPFKVLYATKTVVNVIATQTLMDLNATLVLMGSMNIHYVMGLLVSTLKNTNSTALYYISKSNVLV